MVTTVPGANRTLGDDLRRAFWRVGVGGGVGVLAGYLVIGPLARLLMGVLRVTSPATVIGVTSDDGFTIGRVTTATFSLLLVCATLGGFAGSVYVVGRTLLPQPLARLALWTVLCGAVGGAAIVQDGGVDFVLLEPTWLAIGGFVALTGLGGLLIAALIDRISATRFSGPRTRWAVPAACVLAPPAVLAVVAAGGIVLALERVTSTPRRRLVAGIALVAITALLIGMSVADLAGDISVLT